MILKNAYSAGRVLFIALLAALTMSACQTVPPKPAFTPEQIAALQDLGFEEGDDGWALNLGSRILFATGADRLTERDRAEIKKVADTLHAVGIDSMRVEGHADNVGNAQFNVDLSMRRAEAVAREMAANGIPYENIQQRGLGTSKPVADNQTKDGRMQNRRATIIVPAY